MVRVGVFGAGGRMGAEVCRAVAAAPDMDLVAAPTFAIGAVMMIRFSRLAASWLPDAEVIEAHHASKRDSPSGTSLATVREIAAGRAGAHARPAAPPASPVEVLPGARGAER